MIMFEEFFGMQHTPFVRDVPVQSLYGSEVLDDTVGRLTYAADRQLFAVVTGDAGSGKSTTIRRFVASLPKDQYITLYLSDSKLTPRWLYKGLLDQLGIESRFYRGDAKRQFQKEVEIIRLMQHKKCVIILDEAHLLDKETLEEFRFLLNYQFDSMSPTALVLVGQNELWEEKLRLRRYAAIRQRIDVRCTLPNLDRAETERYIRAHMVYAGCENDIFTDKALDEVFRISAGIPRVINRICEKSLMYAYQKQKHLIDDYSVRYVSDHELAEGGNS